MVFGLGIDIIEITRVKKSIQDFGERFISKVYTEKEIEYCNSKSNKYQHFAARFAAKEAVYKALASGWKGGSMSWKDIEILNEPSGLPKVKLSGMLQEFLSNDKDLKISMSHSDNYVTCVAIIFSKNK